MRTVFNRNVSQRKTNSISLLAGVILLLALALTVNFSSARADALPAATLCGNGSAPDYGFTYDLRQAHWTVGWERYTSEQTVNDVDTILDRLNADSIAQTMILILPEEAVGNRVNCAVHFLRYMQLGLPEGERKDNGFVFLIVVENGRIDVHYGVGLGLPALTAQELTDLNRTAEETYQTTGSLDKALLTLVNSYNTVARNNYAPLANTATNSDAIPLSTVNLDFKTLLCLICVGIIILMIIVGVLSKLARSGITFGSPGSGSGSWGGMGGPFGGGGSSPPFGGGGGSSPTRGGSGSGRSGRGN